MYKPVARDYELNKTKRRTAILNSKIAQTERYKYK